MLIKKGKKQENKIIEICMTFNIICTDKLLFYMLRWWNTSGYINSQIFPTDNTTVLGQLHDEMMKAELVNRTRNHPSKLQYPTPFQNVHGLHQVMDYSASRMETWWRYHTNSLKHR